MMPKVKGAATQDNLPSDQPLFDPELASLSKNPEYCGVEEEVFLLYGSNIGDRQAIMGQAAWEMYLELGEPVSRSSMYETAAWGITDQEPFLNRVISYNTSLRPSRILELIEETEKKLGRVRYQKWGPRIIDIDILFYGNIVYESPELQIPHPQLHKRRFVLAPLVEICPDMIHPVLDKTVQQLYDELDDGLEVKRL